MVFKAAKLHSRAMSAKKMPTLSVSPCPFLLQALSSDSGLRRHIQLVITETNCKSAMQSVQQDFGPVLADVGYRYTYWTPLVLVATKIKPLSVQHGFPLSSNHIKQGMGTQECEDRCVTLELESVYLVCAYVPNSGRGMDRRRAWNEAFATFLRSLDLKKPVIWTGDFNVVGELDTSRDFSKIDPKPPGATLEEWQAHQALLDPLPGTKPWRPGYHKFVDIWRLMNGNKRDGFTYLLFADQLTELT